MMIRKKALLVAGFAIIVLLFAAGNGFADVIDLWDSFPDTQGENNFYAYGYNTETLAYRTLADGGSYYFNTPIQPWSLPLVRREPSPWLFLHPTSRIIAGHHLGPEDSVLAYRIGETAEYNISGQFAILSYQYQHYSGDGSIGAYIKKNDTVLWSTTLDSLDAVDPGVSYYNTADFNLNESFNTNDMLYFATSAGTIDDEDWGQLRGDISWQNGVIPEPATMALFGLGLFGLTGLRNRKR